MNTANGFIRIHRKITQWEWYQNPNTFRVFLHLLLIANFVDGRFEGKEIKRGQVMTSLPSLANQTSLSVQQVRTAIEHLKSTGEITDCSCTQYRIITIVKYNDYQKDNRQDNRRATDDQQTSNIRPTDDQQQYKNNKNDKKERREENNNTSLSRSTFMKPTIAEVVEYCQSRNSHVNPDKFFDYYESNGWRVGKNPMKDWKAAVRSWERNESTEKEYQEREARLRDELPY